jgi:hypothetical protein
MIATGGGDGRVRVWTEVDQVAVLARWELDLTLVLIPGPDVNTRRG